MKKLTAAVVFVLFILSFSACQDNGGYEVPTYLADGGTTSEPETELVPMPSMEEMCPDKFTQEIPISMPLTFQPERIRMYKEISAEQSYMTDTDAPHIYQQGHDQYFVFSDKMALVILTDGDSEKNRTYFYSAYYNEDGRLFFLGDDIYSWYYDASGKIYLTTFSYYFDGTEIGVTFYDENGDKIGSIADDIYYDEKNEEMTFDERFTFLQRIGEAAEIYVNN